MDEAVEDFLDPAQFPLDSFLEELLELVVLPLNLLAHLKITNTERVIATIILMVSVISIMLGNLFASKLLNLKYI